MLELLEGAQASIDELMHDTAVRLVEQLLVLSAQELAGAKQRGREGGTVLWHGAQRGVVALAERQLQVQRPRLRDKSGREVHVPTYERLRDDANIGTRVRDILVAGVSTRRYAAVLPKVAGTVGVSKSTVSRRFIEASAAQPGGPGCAGDLHRRHRRVWTPHHRRGRRGRGRRQAHAGSGTGCQREHPGGQ